MQTIATMMVNIEYGFCAIFALKQSTLKCHDLFAQQIRHNENMLKQLENYSVKLKLFNDCEVHTFSIFIFFNSTVFFSIFEEWFDKNDTFEAKVWMGPMQSSWMKRKFVCYEM